MSCPFCGKPSDHGYCKQCEEYCGCSFDPTSLNDYCSYHRPAVIAAEKGGTEK